MTNVCRPAGNVIEQGDTQRAAGSLSKITSAAAGFVVSWNVDSVTGSARTGRSSCFGGGSGLGGSVFVSSTDFACSTGGGGGGNRGRAGVAAFSNGGLSCGGATGS